MYLTLGQPVRRRRRGRTLGDSSTAINAAEFVAGGLPDVVWNPIANTASYYWSLLTNPATPSPPSLVIPGSGYSDLVQNAITGQPTQAQLNYNADQYTAAASNMAQVLQSQGVPLPPPLQPGVPATQAAADQAAYAQLIGGTAGSTINTWALWALAGIVGLMVIAR